MQALDLNLASRPFKNNTLLWVGLSTAALAIVLAGLGNLQLYRRHRGLLDQLQGRVVQIETRLADLERRDGLARRAIGQFDLEQLEVKAAKANEVIRWKAFSWTRLFNLLEELQPWDVQMASVHPTFRVEGATDAQRKVGTVGVPVSVEGIARDLEAFLEFERALLRSPSFSRVEPERTQRTPNTGEIVFALRFHYDPQAAEGPPPRPPAAGDAAGEAAGEPVPDPAAAEPVAGDESAAPPADPAAGAPDPPAEPSSEPGSRGQAPADAGGVDPQPGGGR